jgi:DNA transposition AAA+ family ATPase
MKNDVAKTTGLTKFSQMFGFLIDLLEYEGEKMGLCYGHPGIGKTTSAKYVAAQERAIYMCAIAGLSQSSLAGKIVETLGGTPRRSLVQNVDFVIENLKKTRTPLIIDEFDYLTSKDLLSVIRTIHDLASVPIVLVGMTGIYQKISAQKLFLDRIHYFLEMTGVTADDTKLIIASKCEVAIKEDLISQIHRQSQGNARRLLRIIKQVESLALAHGLESIGIEEWGDRALVPASSEAPSRRRSA